MLEEEVDKLMGRVGSRPRPDPYQTRFDGSGLISIPMDPNKTRTSLPD